MTTETELKLNIPSEEIKRFKQQPLLQKCVSKKVSNSGLSKHLFNTYFDTPDHSLLSAGIGLRVRQIGDKRIQTMKTAGSGVGGLHQRREWEVDIDQDYPDMLRFPQQELPSLCQDPQTHAQLQPVFTTDFQRTIWTLQLKDGSEIEVALDEGSVRSNGSTLPLSEVELELKAGSPISLYAVALDLLEEVPLTIENRSKAERGYSLHSPPSLGICKAGTVGLKAKWTVEQAFTQIIWHCISQLQANEPMVLHGEDIEGVHQMRVAIRRLRSCLSLYKPLIPPKSYRELRNELKWLANLLGVARDWDVFNETLQHMHLQLENDKKLLKKLQSKVDTFRERAYKAVRKTLRSPRYSRLLLSLGKWLTEQRWRQQLDEDGIAALEQPCKTFAAQVLDEQYITVRTAGENLMQLPTEERHEVRILVKKLGYGIKFFAELYPNKVTRPYIKAMSTLQDELGILNDVAVATSLLNQADLGDKDPVRYFMRGWYAQQQAQHMDSLVPAWDAFTAQPIFWK